MDNKSWTIARAICKVDTGIESFQLSQVPKLGPFYQASYNRCLQLNLEAKLFQSLILESEGDVAMVFDQLIGLPASREVVRDAMERTLQ